jgi:uncharacterized protein (TIGR03435 family)
MSKRKGEVCATITVCASVVMALAQSPQPSFDVVSVKENTSDDRRGDPPPVPGRLRMVNWPLRFVVLHAFQLLDQQLVGAPAWTESTGFDITATFPVSATDADSRAMLRTMLADRFGLKTHRETRELPIFVLVMAHRDGALGPQLVRSTTDCEKRIAENGPQRGAVSAGPAAPGKRPVCQMVAARRFIRAGTQTMQQLVGPLQAFTGRPVVDRTGLTGAFDFDLEWTSGPTAQAPGTTPSPDDGPSIFTALQEQLGLRLESGRGPFEVVVIDDIRRPTPD